MTREELLEIAKPILFNTEMVQAILNGRKSETRRVIKPQHLRVLDSLYHKLHPEVPDEVLIKKLCEPLYQAGDFLYIRETWQRAGLVDDNDQVIEGTEKYYYAAGPEIPCFDLWVDPYTGEHKDHMPWHPSIHMPKKAARIFLKVSAVRVERLQDMNGQDILREGVSSRMHPKAACFDEIQKEIFSELWDSTIPKKNLDKYCWNANPWVWVIEFERIEEQRKEEVEC